MIKTNQETKELLDFIFGTGASKRIGSFTSEDIKISNELAKELVEKSCWMSYIESLFRSSIKPNATLKGIFVSLAKKHRKGCANEVKNGEIYESVRLSLKRNWKSAFEIRVQTGTWY